MPASFKEITSAEELDRLFEDSGRFPVVLFKHSLTCSISAGVYEEVINYDGEINMVIVQNARDVSDKITGKTGIRHESPQAIVIKNSSPVYHASHYQITAEDIHRAVMTAKDDDLS